MRGMYKKSVKLQGILKLIFENYIYFNDIEM